MTEHIPPAKTTLTPHAEAARAARLAREAAALRDNLRRRKQQKLPGEAKPNSRSEPPDPPG